MVLCEGKIKGREKVFDFFQNGKNLVYNRVQQSELVEKEKIEI